MNERDKIPITSLKIRSKIGFIKVNFNTTARVALNKVYADNIILCSNYYVALTTMSTSPQATLSTSTSTIQTTFATAPTTILTTIATTTSSKIFTVTRTATTTSTTFLNFRDPSVLQSLMSLDCATKSATVVFSNSSIVASAEFKDAASNFVLRGKK